MTPKQRLFASEYLVDLNATQAAIRAGYSKRSAYSQGQRLLKNDEVSAAITEGQIAMRQRAEVEADALLAELDRIAMANLADVLEADENGRPKVKAMDRMTRGQLATLQEFSDTDTAVGRTIKVKQHDKLRAIELALRRRGVAGGDDITIRIERE